MEQMQIKRATRAGWGAFVARQPSSNAIPHSRRRAARHRPECGAARLTYEQEGRPISYTTVLLEVSATGLMIKTRRLVPGETELRIEVLTEETPFLVVGTVVHSTQTVAGFKTGVQLTFPAGG